MIYKPLPDECTIKESGIHGLGLFATTNIDKNHDFGITHIKHPDFMHGYIRTPLGGFFNHSVVPNCKVYKDGDYLRLISIMKISAGTEITAKYTLYDPEKNGVK